jgi:phosphoribosylformylglycinamidine (FGAM) synthase-like enzyme
MPDTATLPNVEDALALGLTRAEYELVCERHGRPPNRVELAMFSLLWSEHCAYKHSKKLLRTLPTEGPHVVMGPGENAGAVDVGNGLVCAFKVESHNHPSAVEPFQGAATGVGGILRDIFAIGARPIAVLDSLRFGEPADGLAHAGEGDAPPSSPSPSAPLPPSSSPVPPPPPGPVTTCAGTRARYLLDGAVAGIGHYGNSVGVPTVGGEVYFEAPYEHSCLVNAMALGLAPRERLVRSAAAGPGNVLVLFGASTGRDGIGGASVLASAELAHGEDDRRPTVQVGDPFAGKRLMECSLELLERGLLVSLQDLGAAGLTSAAAEMASKGGVGVELDVAKVPLREPGMEPFEVMVSESQERMLCVAEPAHVDAVLEVCAKWEVNGAAIGTVTDTGRVRVLAEGEAVGDMPVRALVDECPLYDLAPVKPTRPIYLPPPASLARDASPQEALLALLSSPNVASRRPLFEQYDAIVQSRTVRRPEEADAAVLAIEPPGATAGQTAGEGTTPSRPGDLPGPIPALAVSIDGNGRRVAADPYTGTVAAVLECASNLACVGAEPLGTTNNLNFGNPEKGHVAWQLTEAVRGLGDACRALDAPIVGGNVSLYNETPAGPIYPTPAIGMVGRLPDAHRAGRTGFARAGDVIALVGPFAPALAASELAKLRGEPLPAPTAQRLVGLPQIEIGAVRAGQEAVRDAVRAGTLQSAHDVAEGGLAVALAECCLAGNVGADITLPLLPPGEPVRRAGTGPKGAALRADLWETTAPHIPRESAVSPVTAPVTAALLFGEGSGGFVVSGAEEDLRALGKRAPTRLLGTVGGERLRIACGAESIDIALAELASAHAALARLFA